MTAQIGILIATSFVVFFVGIIAFIQVYNHIKRLRFRFIRYEGEIGDCGETYYFAVVEKKGVGIATGCQSIIQTNGLIKEMFLFSPECIQYEGSLPLDVRGAILTETRIMLFKQLGRDACKPGHYVLEIAGKGIDYNSIENFMKGVNGTTLVFRLMSNNAIGINQEVKLSEIISKANRNIHGLPAGKRELA